ncbi:MAG: SDR family oxidoreductase [Rhodospirillales bacterium]|nr:SDR family oxidoreductase [Rhodospirillales bacterium]
MTKIHRGNVLITGAAKRIGRVIALELARAGWNIAVHYRRSEQQAEDLVCELESYGVRGVGLAADLANEAEVGQLFANAGKALGPITCLINNASIFEEDTATTATRRSWDRHMNVNLRAPFVLSQCLVNGLPEGQSGVIINIIDQRVWNPTPEFTSYTLSKMGLWSATQVLAQSYAPHVRVNAIGPGPTLQSVHQSADDFTAEVDALPLQRGVSPEDISRGVVFILESPTMTGQMIALDSGQHLGWRAKQKDSK